MLANSQPVTASSFGAYLKYIQAKFRTSNIRLLLLPGTRFFVAFLLRMILLRSKFAMVDKKEQP